MQSAVVWGEGQVGVWPSDILEQPRVQPWGWRRVNSYASVAAGESSSSCTVKLITCQSGNDAKEILQAGLLWGECL